MAKTKPLDVSQFVHKRYLWRRETYERVPIVSRVWQCTVVYPTYSYIEYSFVPGSLYVKSLSTYSSHMPCTNMHTPLLVHICMPFLSNVLIFPRLTVQVAADL